MLFIGWVGFNKLNVLVNSRFISSSHFTHIGITKIFRVKLFGYFYFFVLILEQMLKHTDAPNLPSFQPRKDKVQVKLLCLGQSIKRSKN